MERETTVKFISRKLSSLPETALCKGSLTNKSRTAYIGIDLKQQANSYLLCDSCSLW